MKKVFWSLVFFLVMAGFCLAMMTIPSDAGGFTSPYFDYDEMRQSQRIQFEHQELLEQAEPWQAKYLRQIDFESQKALKEVDELKSRVKFDSEGYNGDLFVILGVVDAEIDLISTSEIKLNINSQEFEFKTALAYWKSFRTHPESPLIELKNYLSRE